MCNYPPTIFLGFDDNFRPFSNTSQRIKRKPYNIMTISSQVVQLVGRGKPVDGGIKCFIGFIIHIVYEKSLVELVKF
jgi:hypothetical protein